MCFTFKKWFASIQWNILPLLQKNYRLYVAIWKISYEISSEKSQEIVSYEAKCLLYPLMLDQVKWFALLNVACKLSWCLNRSVRSHCMVGFYSLSSSVKNGMAQRGLPLHMDHHQISWHESWASHKCGWLKASEILGSSVTSAMLTDAISHLHVKW